VDVAPIRPNGVDYRVTAFRFEGKTDSLPVGFESERSRKNTALLKRLAVYKPFKAGSALSSC
jgi:hypothetical protein